MIVSDEKHLLQLCREIREAGVVGFDTEFVFERTYWPRLGLVQIAAPDGPAGAVDPLAFKDLSPLYDLLLDKKLKVIVHAGGMDWKILLRQGGALPAHVFDTQIAASFLGYGPQVGYGPLVESTLGVKLDKTETYTDWLKRPLTARQVEYAVGDVTHLLEVYSRLDRELGRLGRSPWAMEEFALSVEPDQYRDPDPYEVFLDIRRAGNLGRKELAVLREIAAWREIEARARDVRPHFLVKDDVILAAAKRMPRSENDLAQIRGIHPQELSRIAPGVLAAIQRALKLPEAEWPPTQKPDPVEQGLDASVNLLQSFVQTRAKEADIATEVLATRSMLKALVRGGPDAAHGDGSPVLKGWRRDLLGKDFIDLLSGRSAVGLDPATRKVKMYPAG